MDKYENLGMIGEGSYGMVMKCRHKETKQLVAIKKFLETEDDKMVKKIALREVRMLKQARHENLINLIEVFRRKKRLYLVFEFMDHTALDDLEKYPNGAEENFVKKTMYQVLKGVEFCHFRNIIHRDVKPENILISRRGVVKLCDFGFARTIAPPGEAYTDYVATRWYRAPELLVGDTSYGRAIDIWAVGCLFSEMLTGEPLFPGESDIDQLYLITKCFGNLIARHREIFSRNPLFLGMRLPEARELEPLERRYPHLSPAAMDIIKWSLRLDPNDRPTCSQLLRHELFTKGGWSDKFSTELRGKIEKEFQDNPLLKSLGVTIHGSVHDAKNKAGSEQTSSNHLMPPKRHAQASHDTGGYTTGGGYTTAGGMTSGTEAFASDMEGMAIKKEKKKKKTKNKELLQHREKAQPEKIKNLRHVSPHPHPPTTSTATTKLLDLAHTSSRQSLTGSRTLLKPLSPRPLAPAGPGPDLVTTGIAPAPPASISVISPINTSQMGGYSSITPNLRTTLASPHPPMIASLSNNTHAPSNPAPLPPGQYAYGRNPLKFVTSPPSSILDGPPIKYTMAASLMNDSTTSLSNQQQGHLLHSEHPSETSLISEKGSKYRPSKLSPIIHHDKLGDKLQMTSGHILTTPMGSPGTGPRLLPGGGVSYKKQYSKSKETFLLPHLKDAELHHMKAVAGPPTMIPVGSMSQGNGLGVGNRGLLLGSHISSIESLRGPAGLRPPATPPSHAQHSSHQAIR